MTDRSLATAGWEKSLEGTRPFGFKTGDKSSFSARAIRELEEVCKEVHLCEFGEVATLPTLIITELVRL